MRSASSSLAALLVLTTTPAYAARPMVTDDARIVDAKACQVESWVRSNLNDKVILHSNVGMLHTITSNTRVTWGAGTETALGKRTWLIAETFQQKEGRPFFQAGVRHWIMPNRVQIDATVGNRFGSRTDERWFSVGLRLLPPAFLP